MSLEHNHTLILDSKDAFKHKLEDFKDLETSPIKPIFAEGLALAKKVVENTVAGEKFKEIQEEYNPGMDFNNILAFVGDRGSGKTSALLSFSKLLTTATRDELNSIRENEEHEQKFEWPSFLALRPIDPSALEGKQRVIEVIIAMLYQRFQDQVSWNTKRPSNVSDELVKATMNAFNDIMRALRIIRHPDTILRETFSGKDMMMERLEELGTITNLRRSIISLVECILSMENPRNSTNSFLIIVIDDADLHLENPMQVLEDLRKYFRVHRLLILMGVRFDQLHSKIAHAYEKELRGSNNEIFDDPRTLADAYLRKLIPEDARMLMPFTNLRSKSSTWKVKIQGYLNDAPNEFRDLFQALRHLIRKKVGITLSSEAYSSGHPFLPNSLREAHDLFSELSRWKDVPANRKQMSEFENLQKFMDFLLRSWAVGKVPKEMQDHLEEIASVGPRFIAKTIVLKAAIVIEKAIARQKESRVSQISNFFDPDLEPKLRILDPNWFPNASYDEIKPMFSPETNPYNIGIGEGAVLMKILDGYYQNPLVTTYVFLIRTIYSMRILDQIFLNPNRDSWRNLVGPSLLPSEILRQGYDPFARIYLSSFEFKGLASKLESSEFDPMNAEWMQAYMVLQSFLVFTPPNIKRDERPYRENQEHALFPGDFDEDTHESDKKPTGPFRPKANQTIERGFFNITTIFSKAGFNSENPNLVSPRPFNGFGTTLEPFEDSEFSTDLSIWHANQELIWPIWNIESIIEDTNVRLSIPNEFRKGIRQIFGRKESLFEFIKGFLNFHAAMYVSKAKITDKMQPDALSYYQEDLNSHPILQLFSNSTPVKYAGVLEKLKKLFSWLLEVGMDAAQIQVRKEIGLEFSDELGRLINSRSQDPRYRNLFRNAIRSLENSNLINRKDTADLIDELRQILRTFEEWTGGGKQQLHVNDRRNFGRSFLAVLDRIEALISPK